jgi:GNAT superfamily N-acetyltransferase
VHCEREICFSPAIGIGINHATIHMTEKFTIRPATEADIPLILCLTKELAEYEKLPHEVTATVELLRRNLFGECRKAEVLLASEGDVEIGFAVFFHNFSTFLGKSGMYLEDLFIRPEFRGRGYGKAMMIHLARIATGRDCARFEWSVLDWNEPSLEFYRSLGAIPMSEWTTQRMTSEALGKLAAQKLPGET